MASKPLESVHALAGPLYALAVVLVLMSTLDFLQSVSGFQPGSIQWRFATVGLLSSYLVMPILGAVMAIVVAAVCEHRVVLRVLGVVAVLSAFALVVCVIGFGLDVLQLRNSVPTENREAFTGASMRAAAKHVLAAVGLTYLGWRAIRSVPVRDHARGKRRVVPLITK